MFATGCAVVPTSGLVRFMSLNLSPNEHPYGEKFTVELPHGFKKLDEKIYQGGLSVTYVLRADKTFYQWSLFGLKYWELLTLTIHEQPNVKPYGTPLSIEGYSGPVFLNDDYSEDGHSNHSLTIYDSSRFLVFSLIIDKARFSKKESIEILSNVVKSMRAK